MDAQRTLRRILPVMILAALAALLVQRRRTRRTIEVLPAYVPKPQLLLPPVQAALVVAEEADEADVMVVAAPKLAPRAAAPKVVVPDPGEGTITAARPAPAGRFERAPVDIVTVVDDLLGTTG